MQANVLEAKTRLSSLLDRASQGEEVIIARHGKPVVRLVPIGPAERHPGDFAGRVHGDVTGPIGDDTAAWG